MTSGSIIYALKKSHHIKIS